ncbi:hypothetical protein PMAC_003316 [Pneumocystis sp. 'macacae']|nr:hypothetical protein PMAC_003316 [Pneumocystis sp. 'macacae']
MGGQRYPGRAGRAEMGEEWEGAVEGWTRWLRGCAGDRRFGEWVRGGEEGLGAVWGFVYAYMEAHTPRKNADEQGFTGGTETRAEDELSEAVFVVVERALVEGEWVLGQPFVLFDFCVMYAADSVERVVEVVERVSRRAEGEVVAAAERVRAEYMRELEGLGEGRMGGERERVQLQALTVFVRVCGGATGVFVEEGFVGWVARVYEGGGAGVGGELLWLVFTLFTSFLWEPRVCEQIVRGVRWLYEEWVGGRLVRDLVLETEIVERFYEAALFSQEIVSELRALREGADAGLLGQPLPGERLPGEGQLRELFPGCSDAFVAECLRAHDGDVEAAAWRILEESGAAGRQQCGDAGSDGVPGCPDTHVSGQCRCCQVFGWRKWDGQSNGDIKNIQGKEGVSDAMLEDKLFVREHKHMIMESLLANDEDEKDDTYEDAGSSEGEAWEQSRVNRVDGVLYTTYMVSPEVFDRTVEARRSSDRKELRMNTGMSDEQIECWKMMLDKNVGAYVFIFVLTLKPRQAEKYQDMYGFSGSEAPSLAKWNSDKNGDFSKNTCKPQFFNTRGKKSRKNR